MSTQYPVLDGRSIDRWRVTELKEELKRRKLITRGLKDDLVKRLDEAIRKDEEAFEEEAKKGTDCDTEPMVKGEDAVAEPQYDKIVEDTMQLNENKTSEMDDTAPMSVIGEDVVEMSECDAITEDTLQVEENKSKLDDTDTAPMGVIGEDGVTKSQYYEITEDTVQFDNNKTSKVDDSAPIGVIVVDEVAKPKYEQMTEDSMQLGENKISEVDGRAPMCDIRVDPVETGQVNVEQEESLGCIYITGVVQEVSVETNETVNEVVTTAIALSEKALESNKINMEEEDSKPPQFDAALDVSHSNRQVYEVSPDLGSQVKSESFSTDSVSIYEKNELKDNLNAYNVHLELDVVKSETVQSSSSGGPASGSDFPSLDDQMTCDHKGSVDETEDNKSIHVDYGKRDDSVDGESLEKLKHYRADDYVEKDSLEIKQIDSNHNSNEVDDKSDVSEVPVLNNECPVVVVGPELSHEKVETNVEKKNTSAAFAEEVTSHDDKEPTDMDSSKKSDNTEGGFMEELNLDHFPDDDFMEEDALETKQVDSNNNPSEPGHEIGLTELSGAKFEFIVDSAEPVHSSVTKESSSEKKDNDVAPSEKRKFQDGVIDEPPKRQRRWNSESLKVPEPQGFNIKPCTTPKGSTVDEDAPKERVVPPSPKPPTNSLRIDRFLRPFTLKAVQELLAKTGKVSSFWMDHIKTHCYVMYSTVEEAVETRNSVYNLQWPPNGGRLLVAEFVDPQEVKIRVDAPPHSPATPLSTTPTVPVAPAPQASPSARQQGHKQQNPPALPLHAPPPPPVSDPPTRRERHMLPPKPQPEKLEPPIVTLDDLFRKTSTTPRIYYLPLAEEQVAAKLARGDKNQSIRN